MVWNANTNSYDSQLIAAPEILFGIYTANDILADDGRVLVTADALVDVLYTDEAGAGVSMQDLPMGEYYAKEVSGTPDVVEDILASYPVTAAPTEDQTAAAAVFAGLSCRFMERSLTVWSGWRAHPPRPPLGNR